VDPEETMTGMNEYYSWGANPAISCGTMPSNHLECVPKLAPCLYDLKNDPCERNNIAPGNKVMVETLKERLRHFNESVAYSSVPLASDRRGDPANYGMVWQPWIDVNRAASTTLSFSVLILVTAFFLLR